MTRVPRSVSSEPLASRSGPTSGLLASFCVNRRVCCCGLGGCLEATHDLDFAIALGASDPRAAAEFLGGEYETGDADDPLQGVIHLSLGPAPASVPVQLVIFPPAFADLIFQHVESLPVMKRIVPVVSWPVLILLKLYAGGPQDLVDAPQILRARQPQQSDLERLRGMAESSGLLKEWASLSHSPS